MGTELLKEWKSCQKFLIEVTLFFLHSNICPFPIPAKSNSAPLQRGLILKHRAGSQNLGGNQEGRPALLLCHQFWMFCPSLQQLPAQLKPDKCKMLVTDSRLGWKRPLRSSFNSRSKLISSSQPSRVIRPSIHPLIR